MCRPPLSIALVLAFQALACLLPGAGVAAETSQPNIVWIVVEDMNDWMGCYGDNTVPTPNIDRLAAEGARFTRAYMPAGVCSACRSAIATGAMQTTLGIHNHRSSRQRTPGEVIHLPDGVKTVYQQMRDAGYFVFSNAGKNDFNFSFDLNDLYDVTLKQKMGFAGPAWRQRAEGQPFFAQIQLKGGKNSGRFRGRANHGVAATDPATIVAPPYYPNVPAIRREIAHHYDCIRQTDDEVGAVLSAIEQDGLLDSTIVFFFTDHGMKLYRHKQWLYEGGIRVPLVVSGPGVTTGSVRNELVSGIDITATTLALAGAPQPSWGEGFDLFAKNRQPREYVISARDRCDYTIDRVRAVTTERYKYIRNFLADRPFMQPQYRDGSRFIEVPRRMHQQGKLDAVQDFWWSDKRVAEELYDLETDPHEIKNLADDKSHQAALENARRLLQEWTTSTDDKGQYPEAKESLQGVYKRWKNKAVNPEFAKLRQTKEESTVARP